MAWYDKYVSGEASIGPQRLTPEQAVAIRKKEFEQRLDEQKEWDKYQEKLARRERRRRRKPVSFKRRKGQRRPDKRKTPWVQRSPKGDVWQTLGRHKEHQVRPDIQVGMSGAPQFASLASMGYKSPTQMGFPTHMGVRGHKYTPRGQGWRREPRGERQSPRAWAERQESLGRPSDYRTYLADRRLRMSTGLQDPMGSAIGAGQQAAGMVGQGIDRINPSKPGNIFHSAGQWLGGMAPSGPTRPSFPGGQVPDGPPKWRVHPAGLTDQSPAAAGGQWDNRPLAEQGPRPKPPTSSHGIDVGGFSPQSQDDGGYLTPEWQRKGKAFYGNLFRGLMQGMWGGVLDELD